MTLPKWLKERIGTPTKGRGCQHVKCIKCRQDVLAGMDEDVAARATITDPNPLSPLGEALALLDGRRTYRLTQHNAGLALTLRAHWDITGSPASDTCIVLTDHVCGRAAFPSIKIRETVGTTTKVDLLSSQEPSF